MLLLELSGQSTRLHGEHGYNFVAQQCHWAKHDDQLKHCQRLNQIYIKNLGYFTIKSPPYLQRVFPDDLTTLSSVPEAVEFYLNNVTHISMRNG